MRILQIGRNGRSCFLKFNVLRGRESDPVCKIMSLACSRTLPRISNVLHYYNAEFNLGKLLLVLGQKKSKTGELSRDDENEA